MSDKFEIIKTPNVRGFCAFVELFYEEQYKKKFMWAKHHTLIAKTLICVLKGQIKHLIVNMPPRYSKTELIIKMFNAWTFGLNPRCNSLHLSYSATLAASNSGAIIETMQLPLYEEVFPESVFATKKVGKKDWENKSGGRFKAVASGGEVTGFGAGSIQSDTGIRYTYWGAIFIDDPLKPADAISNVKREAVNDRWDSTIKSRTNGRSTPVIVVMQRLHELDFVGTLELSGEYEWYTLMLPAILDEGTDEEQPLWPERHTIADLKSMRAQNPYVFDAQYQQDPSPAGGGLFDLENFGRYSINERNDVISRCNYFFITSDTAYTKDTRNDPSCIQLWGADKKQSLYLIDQRLGHYEFPELIMQMFNFVNIWKEKVKIVTILIEAKASGKSLVQQARKQGLHNAKEWTPAMCKYPDDKVGRAECANWSIINGCIHICDNAPWSKKLIKELEKFTRNDTHAHDDQVDAMTMAVAWWNRMDGGITAKEIQDAK